MSKSSAAALITATPEAVAEHARVVIEQTRADLANLTEPVLDHFDEMLARIDDARRLSKVITQIHPDQAMRAAGEAAETELDKVVTAISLDESLYRRLSEVDLSDAGPDTAHWMFKVLRDFRRSGVDRPEPVRERLRELRDELVGISQEFSRNINTDKRFILVPEESLAGLPQDYIRAHPPQSDGMARITTEYADYGPFMTYAHDTTARERLWREFLQRAHPANGDVLRRMLESRYEMATLLGYGSWAQFATEDKMIGTEDAAAEFIAKISAAAQTRMRADYANLLARKQQDDPTATEVGPWETAYLSDRIRAEQFAYDSQAMRPFFEYHRVKDGLMAVAAELFGVEFVPRPDIPVWHSDVDVYDVVTPGEGELLGRIFLDMHPRQDKFTHAAMFSLVGGKAARRAPECLLVCNFPRPGEHPALMQHSEVVTFFHEFGHLLHHIFGGAQRWAGVSGVRTEWDFAEAPSQLLEEWTRDAPTLARFAVHHETGQVLPAEMVTRMKAAAEFGKGLLVRQQMSYAELSLSLYQKDPAGLDPLELERAAWRKHMPFEHVDGTWMHRSFGHLDGYSAIYYTYMWSLVIAKDMFTAFDPGDLMAAGAAARYREKVLAPGGSAPAAELVRDFLGREFTFDAYQSWLDS